MFWNTMVEEREIDRKLKTDDTTLTAILDDIHCLQEIRNSHEPLMNFLKREVIFREMLSAVLIPQTANDGNNGRRPKEEYRFAHQCCEAICVGAREFYPEFEKYPELVEQLTNFLAANMGMLNPLVVSFYSRIVISFLSAEPEKFLGILETSTFLENCMAGIDNCSLFELLCTIANCMPDPGFRDRIKQWYVSKEFANRLLEHMHPSQPSAVHENTAALWVEFIKALRDFQYNVEQCPDPLLNSVQSEESVLALLNLMFPPAGDENGTTVFGRSNASTIANGTLVLNTLLETNQIRNSPSWLLLQEAQGNTNNSGFLEQQNLSFSSEGAASLNQSGQQLLMDPERVVETDCAERAQAIFDAVLESLDSDPDDFLGDQLCGCMQLLINLTNTNFLPTHLELLRVLSTPSNPLQHIFESIKANPMRSIFNAQLVSLISHILYSTTGTQRPLIDFIVQDFNLPALIRQALCMDTSSIMVVEEKPPTVMFSVAKRSFFLQLGNRLMQSQLTSPNADYIERLIKELPDHEAWADFCSSSVQSFVDQNRSEKVLSMSTTNRSSNAIEIDELPGDNILSLPNMSADTQNLFGEFHELKLDPMFMGTTTMLNGIGPQAGLSPKLYQHQ